MSVKNALYSGVVLGDQISEKLYQRSKKGHGSNIFRQKDSLRTIANNCELFRISC